MLAEALRLEPQLALIALIALLEGAGTRGSQHEH
jgi:hypothetical protein